MATVASKPSPKPSQTTPLKGQVKAFANGTGKNRGQNTDFENKYPHVYARCG